MKASIRKNKTIVDGFDSILKDYVDQNCSTKKWKKEIYKYRWILIKAVLRGEMDYVAFKNIDDKIKDFDTNKGN